VQHLALDKKLLRGRMRQVRKAVVAGLAPAVRQGLTQALARQALRHMPKPICLGSYAAMGDEVDPRPLEMLLRMQGCQIGLPVLMHGALEAALDFWPYEPETTLEVGPYGILQPKAEGVPLNVDMLLVPLLAATHTGVRLGQGGGYYDRTLQKLRQERRITAIGMAWDCQIVDTLPSEPWDQRLDYIATPSAWIDCRA
jgi:5-formyltetrahydrofolate cyclo-ligase